MLEILAPAASARLASPDALRAEVSGLTAADAATLLDQASAIAAAYLGRRLALETVRETLRLDAPIAPVALARWPVASLVSVTQDGTELVRDTDYELEAPAGLLHRLNGDKVRCWEAGKIVVEYAAGYVLPSGAPPDLARACLALAAGLAAGRGGDPRVRSESSDAVSSVSYFDPGNGGGAIPAAIAGLLDPYRDLRA